MSQIIRIALVPVAILSLAGALTYSELATMYPQSGGVYVFLREGLGRPVAFTFGWTYMLITKPFAAAGIAVVFAGVPLDQPGFALPSLPDAERTLLIATTERHRREDIDHLVTALDEVCP